MVECARLLNCMFLNYFFVYPLLAKFMEIIWT